MATPSQGPSASTASNATSSAPTDEVLAAALWTFIQAQAPRFTFADAVDVVRSLNFDPHEDHKTLAKRLRKTLQERRIALKHVNALQAAARVAGHSSWHTDDHTPAPRLRFETFEGDFTSLRTAEFSSWSELAVALRAWADKLHARGQLPLGVLTMTFTGHSLNFTVPVPKQGEGEQRGNEMWPVGGVAPVSEEDEDWLTDAPAALEKLRRHLEETGKAVLDGYAALYLCANSSSRPGDVNAVTAADVVNSELVLLREDDEDDPHSGYEIARGDELTCWHQLELSLRDDSRGAKPSRIDITVPTEGVGAWFVNGIRYVWAIETLKPNEYVPGRVFCLIGPHQCERLLRRYKLAKRIHSGGFKHHDFTKRVGYLSGPEETWRVDLHRLLHILDKASLTWESYIEKFEAEKAPMEPVLPVGFVMKLLEDLKVEEPNKVFAWPMLADMALVTDDRLLCSLMPRVESVRYAKPRDLEPERAADLHKAVDDFASALQAQKMVAAGALPMENELPYLVYASDAQELRASVEQLGLQMYVAVAPHLTSTKGLVPEMPGIKTWPWAFGHALLMRFERVGGAQ